MTTNRRQVVDHREREQERPELSRSSLANEPESGEGERDVRGDRDRPAVEVAVRDQVDRQVGQPGADHGPEGGGDRQRRIAAVAQRAEDELALDLQGDDVEEDRHQAVVHDLEQVEMQLEVAHARDGLVVPEVAVGVRRGVGPDERGDRREHEDEAAAGLRADELLERAHDPSRDRAVGARPRRREVARLPDLGRVGHPLTGCGPLIAARTLCLLGASLSARGRARCP